MNIGNYTLEEFLERIRSFHGSTAPGVIIGGIMVDTLKKNLPPGEFFDVICESAHCLPDAVQVLTPCTTGNGWLKLIDTGRFAMTFFNKYTGEGARISLDHSKLSPFPEIRNWYLRLKDKHDQDLNALIREIVRAGSSIYTLAPVQVKPEHITAHKKDKRRIVICPSCNEAFPETPSGLCDACGGKGPYV